MAKLTQGTLAIFGALILAIGAGCGGSDASEAETPTNAQTVTNGAPASGGGGDDGGGDAVAVGETVFEGSCQSCHPAGGNEPGVGPVLAGAGLTAEAIRTQIVNGKGAMPANLVQGKDLEDVTAYVESIQ